jgi:thiol-disulfide isomerase/thioredoxin
MKKILTLIFGLAILVNTQAQIVTGFNNITDANGNSHSLSTYLNNDKFVILNFYLETCGNCIASAPMIQSIYNDFGQNECELIVLNIIVQNSPPYYTDQECIDWMVTANCTGPPNFSNQAGIDWGQFYSVHGGGFAQSYLITPLDNSVIFSHAGGVLDEIALRAVLNNSISVGASNSSSSSETACDTYDWNGQTYNTSGNFDQSFANSSGCDSVHTLMLTINSSNSGSASYTSPNPIIWEGQNITTSGSYTSTFTNVLGCDSVATLEFTLGSALSVNDASYNTKKILKVVDLLGRESAGKKNETLFYIFNDGTVEKRIIVE